MLRFRIPSQHICEKLVQARLLAFRRLSNSSKGDDSIDCPVQNSTTQVVCQSNFFKLLLYHPHTISGDRRCRMAMKFCMAIICRIGTCWTIQLYSPGGTTFRITWPVAVTTVWSYPGCRVARSAVFPPIWTSMIPYYWLRLIKSNPTGPIAAAVTWPSHCNLGGPITVCQ